MKRVNKFVLGVLVIALSGMMATSCFVSEEDYTYSASAAVTVAQINGNPKLITDDGGIVYPTATSVSGLTDNKGFDPSCPRVYVYFDYKKGDVETGADPSQYVVNNAELTYGRYFDMQNLLSRAEAEAQGQLMPDSIFTINQVYSFWVTKGFVNVTGYGYYSYDNYVAKRPTTNLVYDSSDISENAIKFTLYYNKHTSQGASDVAEYEVISAYPLSDIESLVPGTDSVTVSLEVPGVKVFTTKMGRDQFVPAEGVIRN